MTAQWFRHSNRLGVVLASLLLLTSFGSAYAQNSNSTHYQVTQTQFGAGSLDKDCSAHYCGKVSIGDAASGYASSAHYRANFGSDTSDVPLLEVITQGGTEDLGSLSTATTATATEIVKVRNYLSNGYSLQITGAAPNQGSHALTNLATPTASQSGQEQFGINLVANTSPPIGTNPQQLPSTVTSFGEPTVDYSTTNLFKYVDGDVVASSPSSSGETDYTISMIFNVSNITPGGSYNGVYSAVVVPVY
jgi:hypothetical protein